jgi:photosystem II stability/assembly factor-like uncharacterized protein
LPLRVLSCGFPEAHRSEANSMNTAHRLYVGTIGEGLWRSTDGGATFVRTSDGMFVECHVRALAVHPERPRVLYLGSEQGLFCSTDGADHWDRIDSPLNGLQIWSIVVLPQTPQVILAGTCPPRLFRSADGGRTWTEPAVRLAQECPRILFNRVTTLLADPVDAQTVWAGVEIDGLYVSRDAGLTWEPRGQGLSSRDIHALAAVTGNGRPRRLLASTNNDLNLSSDDGQTWQPLRVGQSLPWPYCRGMVVKPGQPEVVLLGNGDAPPGSAGVVARSTDGGQTWHMPTMPGRANSTIWNFAVHAADPELMYASSVSGEVYRSDDGGATWRKLPREFGEIRALAWAT